MIFEKPDLGELSVNNFFNEKNCPFNVSDYLLFQVISGSKAYGLDHKNSDTDLRGVIYLPEEYIFGLNSVEQVENQSNDVIFYSLKKFFNLLIKNNVHALEILWMPEKSILYKHPIFEKIIKQKSLFMSKRIGYTCGGYAFQQVKLMFVKKANNSGRQEIIQKIGFDGKMASHALRILRMGREALKTGKLNVYREDRNEILEIKEGKYKLHELAVLGKNSQGQDSIIEGLLKEEFDKFYSALEMSNLPSEPNFKEVQNLLINIQKELYSV